MSRNDRKSVFQFLRNRAGSVTVIFALASPMILGFAALGVEVGLWYQVKAKLQAAADAAAIAGARELAAGSGMYQNAAIMAAHLNGCTAEKQCTLDAPTSFRTSSAPSASDNGVQVTARTSITFLMAGMFLPQDANGMADIHATGKAAFTSQASGGTTGCVLGLDTNAAYTVWLKNNATLNCAAMSNSKCQGKNSTTCILDATTYGSYSCSSSIDPQCGAKLSDNSLSSMYLSNNAHIAANAVAAGLIYLSNNAAITGTKTPNSTQVTDPYAALTISTPSSTASPTIAGGDGTTLAKAIDISIADGKCSAAALTYANNLYIKIHPGCYNGWDFQNNVNITLDAGTYYIKTKFTLMNNAIITATNGTTMIFAGTGANSYAINVGNNSTLSITAPSSGTYKGIALMGDPAGKETIVQTFSNNAILSIKGAVYFRKQILNLENNAMSSADGCLQLIARRVLFSNNATIGTNCGGVGTTNVTIGQQVQKIVDIVE